MAQTIKDLVKASEEFDAGKIDYTCKAHKELFAGGKFLVDQGVGGVVFPHEVEEHALDQLATRLDIPPGYLKRCPPHVKDTNLNHWLGDLSEKARYSRRISATIFTRTYGDNVRAFLTDSYAPIDNTDILKAIDELMPDVNYKLIKPSIGRDDIYVRTTVLDGIGPNGNYGFGAYIHNGETGSRGLCVAPFLMRTSCTNSTVWLEHAFRVRHVVSSKHSQGWLLANVKEALGRAFRLGDTMIENVVKAEAARIPDLNKVIAELSGKYKMSREEERMVSIGTESERTKMGLINGLTYMAKALEDQDRRLTFEGLAGAILAEPGSLFDVASRKLQHALVEL
jgi:hypothetical protein